MIDMGDSFVARGNELGCGIGKCLVYSEHVHFSAFTYLQVMFKITHQRLQIQRLLTNQVSLKTL